jgi:hypothetical protein
MVICVKTPYLRGAGQLLHSANRSARSPAALQLRFVLAAIGHAQVLERHRIEIVIGERNEANPSGAAAQFHR